LVDIVDIVYYNIFYLPYLCLVTIYTCITFYYKYIHPMSNLDTREINPIQFFSIFNTYGIQTHLWPLKKYCLHFVGK